MRRVRQVRIKIAAGILIAILIVLGISYRVVTNECDKMHVETEHIQQLLDAGSTVSPTEVEAAMTHLESTWAEVRVQLQIFVPSKEIEETDMMVARLRPMYIEECDELRAELASLSSTLERIRRAQLFVW